MTACSAEVTLAGLHDLRRRIDQQRLNDGDWPLVGALVSKLITRTEARQERMIAKISAGATDRGSAAVASGDADANGGRDNPASAGANSSPGAAAATSGEIGDPSKDAADELEEKKRKGHGRNGAAAYTRATHVLHALASGIIGMLCAVCKIGRMSRYREKVVIRIVGQPLFGAELHHLEQARCRNCGHIIRAEIPAALLEGIGTSYVNYDWSACGMLIVMHYFGGAPFKRLESLHAGWGVPIADANQWCLVDQSDDLLLPLYKALERHGIEKATSFRIDDTGSMIIKLRRQIQAEVAALELVGKPTKDIRTGINATAAYWETPDGPIILFLTGRHHAGEIVDQLLKHREVSAGKLVKVTDGASKNFDHDQGDKLIEGTCNAHALLKFRAIKDKYPDEYAVAGRIYKLVFDRDDEAKALGLSAEERMRHHQRHSLPLMNELKAMAEDKLVSKSVEPSSLLWEPLSFIVNQWHRLIRFCEVPGVPLDTNLVEQALIIPVRYLAGSFNYQTEDGATVGDHLMSLIASARANGVEPVAYLTECLRSHEDLAKRPDHYLPWAFRARLEATAKPPDPAPEQEPSPRKHHATLRQSSGKAQLSGSPPQIRTCSSRASSGEHGWVPSPVGQVEKHPLESRFVQSQNPPPS